MLTIALSHLLGRGVHLEAHEAVALARELLTQPCGNPTPANIELRADGSASCTGTAGTPTVASVADLLLTLLPVGTANVPAALRYAIARGLEVVEAPPFASVEEFSSALQRFEKGSRRDVLREVVQRARPARPIAVAPTPLTTPAPGPSQSAPRDVVVPPTRPTLVVRKPAASWDESPIAAAAPILRSFGAEGDAGSPVRSSRRWALAAAAALVASFAVGFAVVDRVIERRAAAQSSRSAPPSPEVPTGASAPNASAANRAQVELRDEIVRVPQVSAVARKIVPPPAAPSANAFSPAFGTQGTAIFFHTGGERDARSAIEVATSGSQTGGDLGIMTIVDDGSHNYHPQPSPDGRLVAFDSDRDGERGIYVANRDGSQVRRVSGAGHAAVPRWSRNGEWLAYIRPEADKPTVWNLWVQPAAGGTARRVTNHRYGQTWGASWFPDDRRIAYSHEDTLIVMDLETGEATRYWTPVKERLVRTPAVSPDGRKIIFQVFRHGAWLLDVADGSMQRVLTDPTAEEFAWSPDGRRVAFHSRRDGQWGIYMLTGSEPAVRRE